MYSNPFNIIMLFIISSADHKNSLSEPQFYAISCFRSNLFLQYINNKKINITIS
jgi:hypothetical protein